jgi:threonine dehydrogenase-like Zn-dependent dehydrogenase
MKALRYDGSLRLVYDAQIPRRAGESLIAVLCAGVCNTDIEITKGYAGFHGTLGHEFVGRVVESAETSLVGKRVVGEINVGCGKCNLCLGRDSRHCEARTVLGIKGRDGAFAEYLSLPSSNLLPVPDSITDEGAVFVEPLAAAFNILEQIDIDRSHDVAIVGDGKLAQLIARLLTRTKCHLTVFGRHEKKLELAKLSGARCVKLGGTGAQQPIDSGERGAGRKEEFDIVVESSGSPSGLSMALGMVKPKGTIILKSTHHGATTLELSRVVVNEVRIFGSRCGRFQPALDMLASGELDVRPLISEILPLDAGIEAFQKAAAPAAMKVMIRAKGD